MVDEPVLIDDSAPLPIRLWRRLKDDAIDWCHGRMWFLRLPLWIFLAYVGVKQFINPMHQSLFAALNLGIHEGGHLIFQSAGQFIGIAAGSGLQCFVPCASMLMFVKQRDYFGISVCFGWLSTNLYGVGVYMADAEKMDLPLVTVGDPPGGIVTHDWHWLFMKMGLLNHCEGIGWLVKQMGLISMLIALALGAWLMWQMYRHPQAPRKATI